MNRGFDPIYDKNSKILILGSFPSVKSREVDFYYGNKRNKFWAMLSEIYGESVRVTIAEKKEFLLKYNIALWDVLELCDIKGSSDSAINDYNSAPARIDWLLSQTPMVKKIICNGKKAYELFQKYFYHINLPVNYLPSTSPANTKFDISLWKKALEMEVE